LADSHLKLAPSNLPGAVDVYNKALHIDPESVYAWNSRSHQFRTTYDPLRRPVETFLGQGTEPVTDL
jgi:hypothetical protein